MKGSDLFCQSLIAQGANRIYGVPGEENGDFMVSLKKFDELSFITTRHEHVASFTAAMEGHLSGQPGICMSTLGPGACNIITGVGQANMDNMPLIVIVGQASTTRMHKVSHQNMDLVSLFEPVTKWATTVRDVQSIPEIVAKAYKVAQEGQPGAVMIELPEDVAHESLHQNIQPIPHIDVNYQGEAPQQDIKRVVEILQQAKSPLLLAGEGAVREEVDAVLAKFLDKTKLYAATTFMGKGSISDRYSQSLHTVGMGMKDIAIEAFDQADVVICVGYDMVEWPPAKWNGHGDKTVIHIANTPAEVDTCYVPDIELVGGIKHILNQLDQAYAGLPPVHTEIAFASIQEKVHLDQDSYSHESDFPAKPKAFLHALRNLMKDDDRLFSDVGAHKMWVARQYHTYQSKTCSISNGFCSMGGSISAAIASKTLDQDKAAVALCGDGGFIMSIQALATASTEKLPIQVIVWVDDHYGLIKWKQEMEFNQESHTALHNQNLPKIAEGFGAKSCIIESIEQFQEAFTSAPSDQPSVYFVPIDYRENMKLFEHLKEVVDE